MNYFKSERYSQSAQTNNEEKSEKEVAKPTEEEMKITVATIADEYNEVRDVIEKATNNRNDGHIWNSSEAINKPEGLNTYMPTKFALMAKYRVDNTDNPEESINILGKKLEELGFQSAGTVPHLGSTGPINNLYSGLNNMFCNIHESEGPEWVDLNCAKISWFWLTEEEETLAHQLETAYYDKENEYPLILYGLHRSG